MENDKKIPEMDRENDKKLFNIISEEDVNKLNILYRQNTFSVQNLLDLIKDRDISIPNVQRVIVWKKSDKIEFIESILIGVPIPSIYLAETNKVNKYEIIDGQQRIQTLKEFILDQEFKLKSKVKDWNNKYYRDLKENYQKKIKRTFINIISIIDDPKNSFMLFHIFARINKGGIKLSHQQIRNSIYQSNPLREIINVSKEIQETKKYDKFKSWVKKALMDEVIVRILVNYLKLIFYFNVKKSTFLNKKDIEEIIKERALVKQLNVFCSLLQKKVHNDEDKFEIMNNKIHKIHKIFNNDELNFKEKFSPFLLENLVSFILFQSIDINFIKQNFIINLFEEIDIWQNQKERMDNPFYNNTNIKHKVMERYKFIKNVWENEKQK